VKTTYYLRTLGASQIEKSTLDMGEYGRTQRRGVGAGGEESNGGDGASNADSDTANDLPGVEDPTCEACQ
jgi:ribonucleoside-diphosphate reductase alpha chain